jgi:hypothetical protein
MNMSYCRFENTANDLRDCYDNMDGDELSEAEEAAKKRLIKLCLRIAEDYGEEE